MERGEEDTEGDARRGGSRRRLRKDAGRAAGKEQQKRRVGEDAGRGAGRRHPSRRLGEDSKKERNEGTHVNKPCRKQEVQAGRTKPEKQGYKRTEGLRTGTDRNKTGINRDKQG